MLRRRSAGFTLYELVLVVALVAIFIGVLFDRMLFYRDQAERTAMQQVIGNLNSALHLQLGLMIVRNREMELPLLLQQNPMNWLAEKPRNYLGEVGPDDKVTLSPGHWYYDKSSARLVYLIAGSTGKNESNRVYLKLKLLQANTSRQAPRGGGVEGVVLEQTGPTSLQID
ncbi:type II secretion system protein [Massilia sp. W12]|uniref:pilus assembly FimT family protein n=1 Tax=Massilia sp. W12 TaxID=3126507 RepID=UPI0030CC8710